MHFVRKGVPAESRQSLLSEEFLPASSSGYRYEIKLNAPIDESLQFNVSGQHNFEDYQEIS